MIAIDIDETAIAVQLAAPFALEDLQFRIDGPVQDSRKVPGTKYARVVVYVDARCIQERLDKIFGPFGWSFSAVGDTGAVHGTLTIGGIGKDDYGEGDGRKAQCSDALKRCAVQWGLGRYLYSAGDMFAQVEPSGKNWKIVKSEIARLRGMMAASHTA